MKLRHVLHSNGLGARGSGFVYKTFFPRPVGLGEGLQSGSLQVPGV